MTGRVHRAAAALRVAQVVCSDAFAGVERYITTLSRALAGDGVEVMVFGGDGDRMAPALSEVGVEWAAAPDLWSAVRALGRFRPFDLVHSHMTAAELASVVASPLLRCPIVATRHFAERRGSTALARGGGLLLTRRLAAQLAISRFVAGCTEGSSVVVAPGTEDVYYTADVADRERTVLVAQRLEAEKRTEDALVIWHRSGLGEEGWVLKIAGDGAQRSHLSGSAARLGISESCLFLGARRDTASLYQQASMLLAPRSDEPFGLSVVEAMAAAVPVVASGGGGHDETVGAAPEPALYRPGDLDQGARLLADLAHDPDRRRSYGAALRTVQRQRFTVDQQLRGTLRVYGSVLS